MSKWTVTVDEYEQIQLIKKQCAIVTVQPRQRKRRKRAQIRRQINRMCAMSKIMIAAAAVLGLTIHPVLAANYHDHHRWTNAGTLTFRSGSDGHHHVLQRLQPGAAQADWGVRAYGCISHPDYGLYTPHFC